MNNKIFISDQTIHAVCMKYDTVLPSGNLYTKKFVERIIKQFNDDKDFRMDVSLAIYCNDYERENPSIHNVACVVDKLYINKEEKQLEAAVLIFDNPMGRFINTFITYGHKIRLSPHVLTESLYIDDICILSDERTNLQFFAVEIVPCEKKNNE